MLFNSQLTSGLIYFVYGLAFFIMGLAILLEKGRSTDLRLQLALRPLAAFGIIHGLHEWTDMLDAFYMGPIPAQQELLWDGFRLMGLAFSFVSLAGFGFSLLAPTITGRRISLLAPLALTALWAFVLLKLRGTYSLETGLLDVANVWTRYCLGVPSALAAAAGLIVQQRAFRHSGMAEFGRDSLITSIVFIWYGLVGQVFGPATRLWPSTWLNEELFFRWFGIPIELLRTVLAVVITVFVVRFMRAFDAEIQRQINDLQAARLQEAQQREALRAQQLQRIVAAQEAERQRIARELHDETGQTLTALGLGLRGVADSLTDHPETASRNLSMLQHMAGDAIDELQRIIRDLRPSHLDDLGLAAALRWYVKKVQEQAKLDIHYEINGEEPELSEEQQIMLFRIAQEGLNNVVKHAQASKVRLCVCFQPRTVELVIQDNGRGFDIGQVNQGSIHSWGLLGIGERAEQLAGDFEVSSMPGRGTYLRAVIPLDGDLDALGKDEDDDDPTDAGRRPCCGPFRLADDP